MRRTLLIAIALALVSTQASAQIRTIGGGGGGGNAVVTDSLKRLANGTAAAPSLAFLNSSGTGLYRFGADTLGFATGGATSLSVYGGASATLRGGAGSMSIVPGTGANRNLNLYATDGASANTVALTLASTDVRPQLVVRPTLFGNATAPVYSFFDDDNTGLYRFGADTLGFATGGVHSLRLSGGASATLAGGAGNMTILAGTGNSRNMLLQATNGSGTATTFLTAKFDTVRVHDEIVFAGLTASSGTPNAVCIDATSKQLTENAASSCVVSSRRFKENISALPYDTALAVVLGLKPSTFTYRQGKRRALGLIAEEAAMVDPRLVTYDGRGQINAVNYEQVTIALLAVVQQQQRDIDQLHTTLLGLLGAGGAAGVGLAGWRRRKAA